MIERYDALARQTAPALCLAVVTTQFRLIWVCNFLQQQDPKNGFWDSIVQQ